MPSHKSCKKRMKTSAERRLRNRGYLSNLRTSVRELRAMTSREEASAAYRNVVSLLDRAAGRGLIHRKNADRHKARLARFVQQLG
ncbi:MAG: 30S ribosomal protein S20 [Candidatus Zixiibacteriota bacterium]|nr:MAG: 30S ribosomal protein S20 [candidate division Zixibacteria bacterium]